MPAALAHPFYWAPFAVIGNGAGTGTGTGEVVAAGRTTSTAF